MIKYLLIAIAMCPTSGNAQENLVYRLESFLNELGYSPGAIDGIADVSTSSAISQYQSDRNLPVSGGMTLDEYQALEQEIVLHRSAATQQAAPKPQQPATEVQQQNATSAPGMTRTVSAGGSVYHRMSSCPAERGIMMISYEFSDRPTLIEFSDLCLDRANGRLWGSETLEGFTLVSRDGISENYEVLDSGAQSYERQGVTVLSASTEADPNVNQTEAFGIGVRFSSRSQQHPDAQISGAGGFLYHESFPPEAADGPMNLEVSVLVQMPKIGFQHPVCGDSLNVWAGAPNSAELTAMIDIRSQTTATMSAAAGTTGLAQGTLTLVVSADGEIDGSASIYMENPRIAGHSPCEWLRAQIEIDKIVGHTVGKFGRVIEARGIGNGRFTDVNGDTFPILTMLFLNGYTESGF